MCATCGCNYKNYQHREGEMKTTMASSNKIYDKQNKDWQKPSPSVPPMPRGKGGSISGVKKGSK